MFKCHYEFAPECYAEIADFIRKDFNILDYHNKQKVWRDAKSGVPLSEKQKKYIDRMRAAADVIFRKFDIKCISEYIDSSGKIKEDFYKNWHGIDKDKFEKTISVLENAHTELYAEGGRPPNMNAVEKLAIAIEYYRYDRTMDNMASHYGVSKRQISETINWVVSILSETIETDDTCNASHDAEN